MKRTSLLCEHMSDLINCVNKKPNRIHLFVSVTVLLIITQAFVETKRGEQKMKITIIPLTYQPG